MPRAELVTLLNDLVRRKRITSAEAAALLARFDQGEFIDFPAAPQPDNNEWLAAFVLLLLLVRGNARRPLAPRVRIRAQRLLRGNFDNTVRQLANEAASGTLTVPAWQGAMQIALGSYVRQMAIAGRGRLPSAALRSAIDERLAEQWPFLDRFAVEQMARGVAGRQMTLALIASRARQYGAAGWASFFQAQGEGAQAGIVEQWISRDDRTTCRICAPRHLQYFLPGQPPYPGTDCLGGGLCRCQRIQVLAPEIYAQLTGQPQRGPEGSPA